MANINDAADKELYESLFADAGNREVISLEEWKGGWPAVVGGINGIPTSRQFNTLQYITDWKILTLYQTVLELKDEIKNLRDQIEGGIIGPVTGKGGYVFVGSINKEINALDILFIVEGDIDSSPAVMGGLIHVGNASDTIASGDVVFVLTSEIAATDTEGGQIYVGEKYTEVRPRGVLLIIDINDDAQPLFRMAGFTNFELGETAPSVENWGFVDGRLTVKSQPETDTRFFVKV